METISCTFYIDGGVIIIEKSIRLSYENQFHTLP